MGQIFITRTPRSTDPAAAAVATHPIDQRIYSIETVYNDTT